MDESPGTRKPRVLRISQGRRMKTYKLNENTDQELTKADQTPLYIFNAAQTCSPREQTEIVQQEGRKQALHAANPGSIPGTTMASMSGQGRSLNAEPGVSPEDFWVCPSENAMQATPSNPQCSRYLLEGLTSSQRCRAYGCQNTHL